MEKSGNIEEDLEKSGNMEEDLEKYGNMEEDLENGLGLGEWSRKEKQLCQMIIMAFNCIVVLLFLLFVDKSINNFDI